MIQDPQKHYEELVKKKNATQTQISRIQGRLDAAKADLQKIEAECRSKNIDPNTLDSLIEQLRFRYTNEARAVEEQLTALDQELAKF